MNARPVARNLVALQPRELEQVPISRMSGLEPVRDSVLGAGKPSAVAPPRAIINRQVVAQHAPVQPPQPFAQRKDKLLVRPGAPATRSFDRPVTQPVKAEREPADRAEMPISGTDPASPTTQPPVARPQPYTSNQTRPQPDAQPSEPGWSHPQARPAPPVQEKTESQAQDEETKYKNWQAKP
ncbi:MAG: hypothetical protein ABSD75_14995 [Terriglobales bacterium]